MIDPPALLEFEEPQHRLLTMLAASLWLGALAVLVFALLGDVVRGIYAGLVVGPLLGFLISLPERWELKGDEFRQVHPKRKAGQIRLSEARSLEAKRQVKGQVDLWVVPRAGYWVAIPTEPGRPAVAFRHELFQRLPPDVLARAQDPLILEFVASATQSDAGAD